MTNTTVHKAPPRPPDPRQDEAERPVRTPPRRSGRISARTTPAPPQEGVGQGPPRPFFLEKRTKILNRRTRTAPLDPVYRRLPRRKPRVRAEWKYRLGIQIGIIAALLVAIAFARLPIQGSGTSLELASVAQEVVQIEEILQTRQLQKPPPPPPPPVPVEVPNDEIIEDDDLDLDATLDIAEPLVSLPPPPPPPDETPVVEVEQEPEIFVAVEQQAEIIGGLERLYELLEYPRNALRAGLGGTMIVQFIVAPDGVPYNPEVVRSAGALLDEAAVKAVLQLRFTPARQRGKTVHYRMALPIRFKFVDRASR